MKVLFQLIRALKISADTIFYPEIQHTDKKKQYIQKLVDMHGYNYEF